MELLSFQKSGVIWAISVKKFQAVVTAVTELAAIRHYACPQYGSAAVHVGWLKTSRSAGSRFVVS